MKPASILARVDTHETITFGVGSGPNRIAFVVSGEIAVRIVQVLTVNSHEDFFAFDTRNRLRCCSERRECLGWLKRLGPTWVMGRGALPTVTLSGHDAACLRVLLETRIGDR